MFINNSKTNWEMFRNAVHKTDMKAMKLGRDSIVKRIKSTTDDLLREVERVVNAEPSEGNFTPLIIGNIMAYELTKLVVDTTLATLIKRQITNSDIADMAAQVASDYTIALANLAYINVEKKLIDKQLAELSA